MHNPNTWELLERLTYPEISPEERIELERKLKNNPHLRNTLNTFRILQTWPALEETTRTGQSPQAVLDHLEHEWELEAVDRELGRTFPFLAAAALAAAVIIGIFNLGSMRDLSNGTLDALFALPQPTFENTLLADL